MERGIGIRAGDPLDLEGLETRAASDLILIMRCFPTAT